jgi:hypothetical protein
MPKLRWPVRGRRHSEQLDGDVQEGIQLHTAILPLIA